MAHQYRGRLPGSGEGSGTPDKTNITDFHSVIMEDATYDGDQAADFLATDQGIGPGSFHPRIPFASVTKIDPKRAHPNSNIWSIGITYETPDPNEGEKEEEPENDQPTISIEYEDRDTIVPGRRSTNIEQPYVGGVQTSTGEPYDPIPTYQTCTAIITIQQNFNISANVGSLIASYQNTINSDTFLGFSAKTVRITSIKPKQEKRGDTYYLNVGFVFKLKESHDITLLDQGSYYLEGGKKIKFTTDDGHERVGLLNKSGGKLADGATPKFLDAIQVYTSTAFSGLGLPSTLSAYKWV